MKKDTKINKEDSINISEIPLNTRFYARMTTSYNKDIYVVNILGYSPSKHIMIISYGSFDTHHCETVRDFRMIYKHIEVEKFESNFEFMEYFDHTI